MRRSILAVCSAVVVIAMVVAPAAARVTAPTNIKDALFKGIWNALLDLQKQIDDLTKRVNNIQPYLATEDVPPSWHVSVPSGYTTDQCACFVSSYSTPCGSRGGNTEFLRWVGNSVDKDATGWQISSRSDCETVTGGGMIGDNEDVKYTLICDK
jgi:hypothetical protein